MLELLVKSVTHSEVAVKMDKYMIFLSRPRWKKTFGRKWPDVRYDASAAGFILVRDSWNRDSLYAKWRLVSLLEEIAC